MNITDDRERRLKIFWNIIIVIISLFVIARGDFHKQKTSPFDAFLINILAPLQSGVSGGYAQIRDFIQNYALSINASKQNVTLRKEIAQYQERIFKLSEIENENQRLRSLLGFVRQRQEKRIFAQVVAYDASTEHKVIRINKGESNGIKLHSPVVTSQGLVGYVYRLSANYSDVLTVLDGNNRVDGIISRMRTHVIVEGDTAGRCLVKYVPRTKPVILGDTVVTSGLGQIYPKGIRIGKVQQIERDFYGSSQTVHLKPSVDFSKIEEVIVLLNEPIDNESTVPKEQNNIGGDNE